MKHSDLQLSASPDHGELAERLRGVGMLLLSCGEKGEVRSRPPHGRDWLADLLCYSPMIERVLLRVAPRWAESQAATAEAILPGLWAVPVPVISRRRVVGFSVGLIPTEQLLDAGHLRAMCQSAAMDFTLCQRLLAQLPPVAEHDILRLAAMVRWVHDDQTRRTTDTQAMETVSRQLGESYEEISLLYTIIQSMAVVERPERFVGIACEELLETLPYAWIGMFFAENEKRLKRLSGQLLFAGSSKYPDSVLRSLAAEVLMQAEPDAPVVFEPTTHPEHAAYAAFGRTTLVHPITADGAVIGLLIAADKQGDDVAASSVDMKLLGATASHTAIFLENAALYDDLNAMFLGTLEALTASIDAKDRYTCGHSQRVAHMTQRLAEAAGLDEHTVSRMRIAGLVHDVGKIGVPERVLLKPGKLNKEEFAWIRKHPEIGYRILKDIPQLQDILPGVLHHHERYDGNGYPEGLAGTDIPLIARLISLADSFDAMSSTRTYRMCLSRDAVLEEIRRCSGSQFDPKLASIFRQLDFTEYDQLVEEHRALDPIAGPEEQTGDAA